MGRGGSPDHKMLATSFEGHKPSWVKVQLMIQRIPDINGKPCTVLRDTGAQISLITDQYAKEAGFKGCPASIQFSDVGSGSKKKSKVQYRVLLRKTDRSLAQFRSYGVDKIKGYAMSIDLLKAKSPFCRLYSLIAAILAAVCYLPTSGVPDTSVACL